LLSVAALTCAHAATRAGVAVVTATPWSPNDPVRDGAQEFAVLMSLATLQQEHPLAGLVGVADKQGSFQNGEERALRFAALTGVPVVKVSANGKVAHCPDELFIEAGALPTAEACRLLANALERCGAPPRAENPLAPTPEEIAAISRHVQRLRAEIALNRDNKLTQN
jgi:hypothetical protein